MKYIYSKLKDYYAASHGVDAWSKLTDGTKVKAEVQINMLRDEIWFHKQWGFCKRSQNITVVPPYTTGTVSGTIGEHVLTFDGASLPAHVEGVPVRGQMIFIDNKLYKIADRISTTKAILASPLVNTVAAGTSYKIYFAEYPIRWDVGGIRDVIFDQDPITPRTESMVPTENTEGTPEMWYPAGQTEEDFGSGTGDFANDSRTVSNVASITPADHHIGMAITPESVFDVYYITDFDAGADTFTLDRPYSGANLTTETFILNPAGTPLIGLRDYPQTKDIIRLIYTRQPSLMRDDNDLSGFPNDGPLLRAIEVAATEWKTVGERGFINEVLFKDKLFKRSLKLLNFRGSPTQLRLMTLYDVRGQQRRYRNTNPWNQPY